MPSLQVSKDLQVYFDKVDYLDPWTDKPILILQHGNGRSSEFWYRWMPRLSEYFVGIRPDMRGVGKSSRVSNLREDISVEKCVQDLVQLIQSQGNGPVYFCGESMGGILGLALASHYPSLIKKLILVATPVYISDAMKNRYSLGHSSRLEAMKSMGIKQWVLETSILTRFPPESNPELLNWYVDEFAKGDPETLVHYSDLVNSANASAYLPKIQCPTLAILPSEGQITSAEQEELLKKQIKDITIAHIPSKYHMIHLTHHHECIDELMKFVKDD